VPNRTYFIHVFYDIAVIAEENKIYFFKLADLMNLDNKEPNLVKIMTCIENTQFKRIEYYNG